MEEMGVWEVVKRVTDAARLTDAVMTTSAQVSSDVGICEQHHDEWEPERHGTFSQGSLFPLSVK